MRATMQSPVEADHQLVAPLVCHLSGTAQDLLNLDPPDPVRDALRTLTAAADDFGCPPDPLQPYPEDLAEVRTTLEQVPQVRHAVSNVLGTIENLANIALLQAAGSSARLRMGLEMLVGQAERAHAELGLIYE